MRSRHTDLMMLINSRQPYPPIPRTPDDPCRSARFRENGSQARVLGSSMFLGETLIKFYY